MVISKALAASVLAASVAGAAGFAPLMLPGAPNTVRGTRAVLTGAGGGRARGAATTLRCVATSGAEVKTETSGLGLSEGLKRAREQGWTEEAVREALDSASRAGEAKMWNNTRPIFRRAGLGEVAMLTRGVIKEDTIDTNGDDDMEVLNISFYTTLIASMILSTWASIVVPDMDVPFMRGSDFRFILTLTIGSSPFAFLGLGLSLPGLLQAALIQMRRLINGEFRDRLARHEAGHFLVGYCLGLPIEGYRANDAILNAVQFFPKTGGVAGRLTHTEVDVLCAVSMAGVVAESIKFGRGLGGFADMSQLQGFISRGTPSLDDKAQQDKVRWGCVMAYTILRNNEPALEALTECMMRGDSVEKCIEAVEKAGGEAPDGWGS